MAEKPRTPSIAISLLPVVTLVIMLAVAIYIFRGDSLGPLNTDSCGSLCGASSLCPRRAPLHTFSGFLLHTVSSVHTSGWSVPFLRSLLFRIILFSLSRCSYIPLSATFVPLATVWIAPAVHVVFGIQEHKKRLLS